MSCAIMKLSVLKTVPVRENILQRHIMDVQFSREINVC